MVTGLVLDRITISSKVLTSPGTTRNIAPMLQVQDSKTYDADGRIEMVTVKSNLQPSLLEMIGGWLDDSIEISDRQQILGNRTIEQNRTLGREQMARKALMWRHESRLSESAMTSYPKQVHLSSRLFPKPPQIECFTKVM